MPVQMCPIEIPDGWEFVESRVARDIFEKGDISIGVIVRPAWQWPEWLTAEWLAMDANGSWWAHANKPECGQMGWESAGEMLRFPVSLTTFTPPPCDDWTKSLRKNPRSK